MKAPRKTATIEAAATWTGRHQAFALIAAKSTLAQARCLRQLRDTKAYAAYDLTWAEYCKRHAGMTRSRADLLIQRLNEFGADYFRVTELVRISEPVYRKLSPRIEGETIEIGGSKFALVPENAPRIRAAVQAVRDELRNVQTEVTFQRLNLAGMQTQLENTLREFVNRARFPLPSDQRESMANLLRHMIYRMQLAAKEFDVPPKS